MDTPQADLHLHTDRSDGKLAPAALVRLVRERGIKMMAVTDHDSIEGLEEAAAAGIEAGVEVVPGVELSVTVGSEEIHLLGYFFDPEHSGLREHLASCRKRRHDRADAMVSRLNAAGVPVSLNDVKRQAGDGIIGRPHVAAALVKAGIVPTAHHAFQRYLRNGGAAYVPNPPFPAAEALALLHSAGGISVLAHPGQWTSTHTLRALVRAGLDGLETVHPSHAPWLTDYYRQAAAQYGLIETGGSDFHGWRPQDDANLGRYTIPVAYVKKLSVVGT